jgi:hypothetical protein
MVVDDGKTNRASVTFGATSSDGCKKLTFEILKSLSSPLSSPLTLSSPLKQPAHP